jgi:hypothetical protein
VIEIVSQLLRSFQMERIGRCSETLDPSINQIDGRTSKWTADECSKLKGVVQTHCGKDWVAIGMLVAYRTKKTNGRTGK